MKFARRLCFVLLAFFWALGDASAQNSVQVAFQNTAETLILDASKSPLTVGTGADGDGAIIQLGYYTAGTASSPFSGSFVALTGPDSANAGFRATSVGDSGGGTAGRFSLVCNFVQNATDSGQKLPTANTPLVIRFLNGRTLPLSSAYNEASGGSNWLWQPPSAAPGTVLCLSLSDPDLVWKDGQASAFRTTLPYVPNPDYFVSVQPADVKTIQGSAATQMMVIAPIAGLSYQLYTSKGGSLGAPVAGVKGVVPSDGRLMLPVGSLPASGDYIVRFTPGAGTGIAAFNSSSFHVEFKPWLSMAASYEVLLEDTNNTLKDAAKYRGMLSFSITRSGAVTAKLNYTEASLIPGSEADGVRAYIPVIRTFNGSLTPVKGSPSRFVFSPRAASSAARQTLSIDVDCSTQPPQVNVSVFDFVSLAGGTYTTGALNCVPAVTVGALPSKAIAGRYTVQSADRAYLNLQVLSTGRLLWLTRTTGYNGSGSAMMRMLDAGTLNSSVYETRTTSSRSSLSTNTLLGQIYLTRATDAIWNASVGVTSGTGALEQQGGVIARTSGNLRFNKSAGNVSSVKTISFANLDGAPWITPSQNMPIDLFKQGKTFRITVPNPLASGSVGATFQWNVTFSASGVARATAIPQAGSIVPPLSLRFDKANALFSGLYISPADRLRRNLYGTLSINPTFSARGWTEVGAAQTLSAPNWSLVPAQP